MDSGLLEKDFVGKVTTLHSTFGQVDSHVFFDLTTVVGSKPVEGSEVRVHARRQHIDAGWVATRVTLLEQENIWTGAGAFELPQEQRVMIGRVTHTRGQTGDVDSKYAFQRAALPEDYVPCSNDWVRCHLIGNGDGWHVESVEPTRRREYTGCITSLQPRMIGDNITFLMRSCEHTYRAHIGDAVEGEAIEHDGRDAQWRALSVRPSTSDEGFSVVPQKLINAIQSCKVHQDGASTSGGAIIDIINPIDLGSVEVGSYSRHLINIRNTGATCVHLKEVVKIQPDAMLDICSPVAFSIESGQVGALEVKFTASTAGTFQQMLFFDFGDECVSRPLTCCVQEAGESLLAPVEPYSRPTRNANPTMRPSREEGEVVPGRRLSTPRSKLKYLPSKLKMYTVPKPIRECCYNDGDICQIVPELSQELSAKNYGQRFAALLFAEEIQNEIEMQQFDMMKVRMRPHGPYLALDVPGLAEGRPSLLLGDSVFANVSGVEARGVAYEGYIHEIIANPERQSILLKFSENFHDRFNDSDYDVAFSISRTQYRRCHLAVELATATPNVLFPSSLESSLPLVTFSKDDLFNKSLNSRQVAAVSRILGGQARPCPYLLFGPPGTGKTVTLVEAILQVFHRMPSSRILACTPSNSAADLLGLRLHQSGSISKADMVRFNAFHRGTPVPADLQQYSMAVDDVDQAARFRLVISTCVTAGMLYSLGLQLGHFSHVFIDEAGQSTEPESLIALGLAANQSGAAVSVLAGDPFQLGPVLQSPLAIEHGLRLSLLERLIQRPIYQRDEVKFRDHGCYDPLLVTKLVHNYRCHPGILELFSRIFYHNELLPCAPETECNRFCSWSELPNPSLPIIFHGIEGADLREGSSPSWYNPAEIVRIAEYLKMLFKVPEFQLKAEEVAVITPYRKQVEKMRRFLKEINLQDVKIGSVEEFQGQERPVVIISTVRSEQSLLHFDRKHQIGFLSNPKRFNVSISRAKSLMIIVGNPHTLCSDPFWRLLVTYCARNGAYRGCELPALDVDSSLLDDGQD